MKEAQKTLDKALDIEEEDLAEEEVDAAPKEANTSWSSSLNKMLKTESTSSQQDDEILEEQNLNPRKRSSIWNSLSGAASLISSPGSEDTTPDDVHQSEGSLPVFSQPSSLQSVDSSRSSSKSEPTSLQPNSQSDNSSERTNHQSEESGKANSQSEKDGVHLDSQSEAGSSILLGSESAYDGQDLDNELLRESIEDGFSSSRLVVTADLAGDNDNQHPYFNSYPAVSANKNSSVIASEPGSSSCHQKSNSDVGSNCSGEQSDSSGAQTSSIVLVSSSSISYQQKDGTNPPGSTDSLNRVTPCSSDNSAFNQTNQVVGMGTSSGSSVDIISPSSIEPISCSSIDVISSPDSDKPLKNIPQDVNSNPSKPLVNLGGDNSALNVSVGSDTTIVVSLEDNEVENMLSDALIEHEKKSVSGSMSSRSSDIVKLDSISGTASPSDVEVISNSDRRYSSSSHSKDDRNEELISKLEESRKENFQLRRRNEELSEILKAREDKILNSNREMTESHGGLASLTAKLEAAFKKIDKFREDLEVKNIENERLENDLKVEKSGRKKLEKELKRVQADLDTRKSGDDKKDSLISDLRSEGEALAKHNGKQAEIIRKLRGKEKTLESERNLLSEESTRLKTENESLTKILEDKNENENAISKSLKSLADGNKTLGNENKNLSVELDEQKDKVKGLRSSLEAAYKDISQLKQELSQAKSQASTEALQSESQHRERLENRLAELEEARESDRLEYEARMASCQEALVSGQKNSNQTENQLRRELEEARKNVEMTEKRYEDLNFELESATRPLLKQIQSLQTELNKLRKSSDETESNLADRVKTLTQHLNVSKEKERKVSESYETVAGKLASLEATVNISSGNRSALESKCTNLSKDMETARKELELERESSGRFKQEQEQQLHNYKKEKELLELRLENLNAEFEVRNRTCKDLAAQLKDQEERMRDLQADVEVRGASSSLWPPSGMRPSPNMRPTSSYSSPSPSNSLNPPERESCWTEELLSPGLGMSGSSQAPSLYDTMKHGNSAAYLENMESQLKLKEGEVASLHHQIQQLDRLKQSLAAELADTSAILEQKDTRLEQMDSLESEFNDFKQKYSVLEKSLLEKEEELNDMRQDLVYVKEKYKTQIDQLMSASV